MPHPPRPVSRAAVRGTALMIGGLLSGGLLLGGCSSSGSGPPDQTGRTEQPAASTTGQTATTPPRKSATTPPRTSATTSPGKSAPATRKSVTLPGASATTSSSSGGHEAPPVAGSLSGVIVSVADGSMRVRTGRATAKVTWAADTNFHLAKAATMKDVRKGNCIVATRGAKVPGAGPSGDQITALRMSHAIGGACAESSPGVQSSNARVVSGLVTSVKGRTVSVQTKGIGRPTATVKLLLAQQAGVAKTVDGSQRDVAKGRCAATVGMRQAQGALAASSITISERGPSGCPA